LPNNSNIILAAQQAVELCDKRAAVVSTKTIPQGISALLALNFGADLETNCEQMTQAFAHVETLEVTQAVRAAQINGMDIEEGQYIGLLNGELVAVNHDSVSVLMSMLQRIGAEEYEILTLYHGQDVSGQEAANLAHAIAQDYGSLEIEVLDGGQAHYHYIISAE
jgi:dihydroxyacetone kinase-like predicted kinase